MKKIFDSWIAMTMIALVILTFGYLYLLFDIDRRLPSENWSREIQLADQLPKYKDLLHTEIYENVDGFLSIWEVDDRLRLFAFDQFSEIQKDEIIDYEFDFIKKIRFYINDQDNATIFIQDRSKLYKMEYNLSNSTIVDIELINKNINSFEIDGNVLVYNDREHLTVKSEDKTVYYKKVNVIKSIVVKDLEDEILLSYTDNDGGFLISIKENSIHDEKITDYNYSLRNGYVKDLSVFDDVITVMTSQISRKDGITFIGVLKYDTNGYEQISSKTFYVNPTIEKPKIVRSDREVTDFIYQTNTDYGTNIVRRIAEVDKDQYEIELTKTRYLSSNFTYFDYDLDQYLVWVDETSENNMLYISGNDEVIIDVSKSLRTFKPVSSLYITFMTYIIAPIFGMWTIFLVVVPTTVLLIVSYYLLKLSRRKHESKESNEAILNYILIAGVTFHILLKLMFTFAKLTEINSYTRAVPFLFENNLLLAAAIVLLSDLAAYITYRWWKNNPHSDDRVMAYGVFATVDLILFTFSILVYMATDFIFSKL